MQIDSNNLIRKLPAMIQGRRKFAKIADGGDYHVGAVDDWCLTYKEVVQAIEDYCEYIDTGKFRLSAPINGSWNVLSAYPYKQDSMDEWCTDCKEYDQERHCCPRFNRVIRETVDEVKANQWLPCSEQLPESDGVYLVYAPDYRGGSSSAKEWHNGVMFAKFKRGKWSVEVGYYNRPGCVKAWMPLPAPYTEVEND